MTKTTIGNIIQDFDTGIYIGLPGYLKFQIIQFKVIIFFECTVYMWLGQQADFTQQHECSYNYFITGSSTNFGLKEEKEKKEAAAKKEEDLCRDSKTVYGISYR